MRRLLLREFVRPGEHYHFAKAQYAANAYSPPHCHDFLEVFWVDLGAGWHRINGEEHALRPGQCALVRAEDGHSFRAEENTSLHFFNIAFARPAWDYVRRRYFTTEEDIFAGPAADRSVQLDELERAELNAEATDLESGEKSRLKIERFLINLAYRLSRARQPVADTGVAMPDWLQHACRRIGEANRFTEGPKAFVRLAGRSPEHTARAARKWLGRSPTEIVNDHRMAYAASQLAGTARPIADIALDCGLENLSHFYHLFRARFGLSPLRYRRQQQRIIRGR